MKDSKSDGTRPALTAKTPANEPKLPPRINAAGSEEAVAPVPPGPPKQLKSPPGMPADVVQSVQLLAWSAQSATHSSTFPTMSNAPHAEVQFERDPVSEGAPVFPTLQSVVPLSVRGSGVLAAAPCHSRLVTRCLPESRHAWFAWNQVMHALGSTPGMETAYTPGEGGVDSGTGAQLPSSGKFAG